MTQLPGQSGDHYEAEVAGYTTWNQPEDTLWYEVPYMGTIRDAVDPSEVEGVWVHTVNLDGNDEHWFWVRSYMVLSTWQEWDDLIENVSDMHNMTFA